MQHTDANVSRSLGTIINDNTILTAAHCVLAMVTLSITRVKVSTSDLSSPGTTYSVDSVSHHPSFSLSQPQAGYDVGVVKLAGSISFKSDHSVKKSCLAAKSDEPVASKCKVIGWGYMHTGRDLPNQLQVVDDPIKDPSTPICYPGSLGGGIICSHQPTGGSCNGDSGGPLICPVEGREDTWLQFGIVSFGNADCTKGASFYTSVSYWLTWIVAQAKE